MTVWNISTIQNCHLHSRQLHFWRLVDFLSGQQKYSPFTIYKVCCNGKSYLSQRETPTINIIMQPAAQFSNFIPAKESISFQGLKKPPLGLSGEKKMASMPWNYYLPCNYVNYRFSFLKYKIEIPRNGQCIFPLVEIYVTCENKQGIWTRRPNANNRLLDFSLTEVIEPSR